MDDEVTEYILKKEKWIQELKYLRIIFEKLSVEEIIKWGAPTYSFQGKNIVGFAAFKNHFGLWSFFI